MGASTLSASVTAHCGFESIRARQYNPAVIEGPSEPASVSFDDINQLLRSWSDGDEHALGELTPVVYAGLRRHALAHVDPRKVHVVEMRFFAGLSVEETAMVLKVSPVTVRRDWSSAKVWLYRELSGDTDDGLGSLETGR